MRRGATESEAAQAPAAMNQAVTARVKPMAMSAFSPTAEGEGCMLSEGRMLAARADQLLPTT